VLGRRTVGVYQLDQKDQVRWIALDLDLQDPATSVEDATPLFRKQVEAILAVAMVYDIKTLIVFSGHKGFHILSLFESPVDAATARNLALGLVEHAGRISHSITIEVFPKQTRLDRERPLGNLLKLPWGRHKLGTRSRFVDGDLTPIDPWFTGQLEHLTNTDRTTIAAVANASEKLAPCDSSRDPGCSDTAHRNVGAASLSDSELVRLLRCDRLIRDLFHGDPATLQHYDTRSGAEYALVLKLLWRSATREQVDMVLQAAGIGKWPEAPDHYRQQTVNKAEHQIRQYQHDRNAQDTGRTSRNHS
jgi:hypothetical protein